MPTLVCLGLGYCARHYVAEFGRRFDRVIGTARTAERAAALAAQVFGGRVVEMAVFDGSSMSPQLSAAVAEAQALLVSAPPTETGDPVLAVLGNEIARAPRLRVAVLLSTLGVYADSGGTWVDETVEVSAARTRGGSTRSGAARVEAEMAWQALGARADLPVVILRLGGIYGPGQNALVRLLRAPAPRIAKPGHVSNRVHVFDIAQAIEAALARCADGIFNVVDDERAPPGEPVAFAAKLIGVEPPPEISYAEAAKAMSPSLLSFYDGCIRAKNDKLKTVLGVTLRYPNYRAGLQALYDAGDHLTKS